MFKRTSMNEQSRLRRHVENSTSNTAGVDSTATKQFPELDQRGALIARKQEIQSALAEISANFGLAISGGRHRRPMPTETIHGWKARRANLVKEITDIDLRLSQLKAEAVKAGRYNKELFSQCFMDTAKEILATPVYDRILMATVHRLGGGE